MKVIQSIEHLKRQLAQTPRTDGKIGLVPTMGALHPGHLVLVQRALQENHIVVVSIFVNPTQFNNKEDLEKYPKTLEADTDLLSSISHELVVFAPTVSEMYSGKVSSGSYDFDGLDEPMEGMYRKGHFEGVATIVEKFFTLISPNTAYFGEKDFQQLQIIKKLVANLNLPIEVIACPIVREKNNLAMSSRNARLSDSVRSQAGFIYGTLQKAREKFQHESAQEVIDWVFKEFKVHPVFELEYFEIMEAQTLKPVRRKSGKKEYRAFIAVYADGVRLIDNIELTTD